MPMQYLIFIVALAALLISARYFTQSAEHIGKFIGLPPFVIGVFIIGIGTSLPELISGIISVRKGASEILAGNIIGANISNLLLITGLAVVINRKNITLNSTYIYIDLHYLIGAFVYFFVVAYDGKIEIDESSFGILMFIVYSIYLIKGEAPALSKPVVKKERFPIVPVLILLLAAVGIYFGANYTVSSLEQIALAWAVPNAVIALTILSLGTTLPELAVNISAIRQGKAEMAVGNVLGSSIFNTLIIPSTAAYFGSVTLTEGLIQFSLPMMAACGLLFYLLTQDKKISVWEGLLFICLYGLFILKTATV